MHNISYGIRYWQIWHGTNFETPQYQHWHLPPNILRVTLNNEFSCISAATILRSLCWNWWRPSYWSPGTNHPVNRKIAEQAVSRNVPIWNCQWRRESIRPRKLPLSSTLASPELLVSRQTVWNPSFRHKTHRTLCDMWWHLRFKSFSALLLESASDWKASYREWRGNWPWSQMIIW